MKAHRSLSQHGRALAFSALLALQGAVVFAQETPPTAERSPGATDAEVIPAAQIPARASAMLITLGTIRNRLQAIGPAGKSGLERIAASVDRIRAHPEFATLDSLPEFRIVELRRQVRFYEAELADDQQERVRRATRLSTDAAELGRLRGMWAATLESAIESRLAEPLVTESRRVLARIGEVERELARPLAEMLAQRDLAGGYQARLQSVAGALDEATSQATRSLFAQDVEPLWNPAGMRIMPADNIEAIRARVTDQLSFMDDYVAAKRPVIQGFVTVVAGLLLLVAWLRRRPQWLGTAAEELPSAGRLLQRPFSSLALVVLLVAMLASEFTPGLIELGLAIAIMIALLRLMPWRMVAGHNAVLFGLAGLIVLDWARTLMPYDSLAFRLDMVVVCLGILAGLAWVTLQHRRSTLPPRSWIGLVVRAGPPVTLIALVGLVANVVGNVSLADLLVRATLASAYMSAIVFAAILIINDFAALFVRSRAGRSLRMVALHGEELARAIERLTRVAAVIVWAWLTLVLFRLWELIAARVSALLELSWTFGELTLSIGGLLVFVTGILAAVYVARAIRFLLSEEVLTRLPWPAGAKSTAATLAYYGVLFAGLLLAFSAAGAEMSQMTLIFGALGVGIGFGLQGVVNNFVSGLILMFERPIQAGDIVDVDTLQGRVMEIGLRATRIKTWEGAEVVVPNGTLLAGNLINWTLSDSNRRVDLIVGVAYGSDVRRVLQILGEVAARQPSALTDPEPAALFTGFGESSLNFSLRFWTRDASIAHVARSDAYVGICDALAAEGIEIPFPQREVHIRSVDPKAAQACR